MDRQALIDAIVADPAQLDAWVVYADWLCEQGELRGEIIQLSLAIDGGNNTDETRGRLGRLMWQLDQLVSPAIAAIAECWEFSWWRAFPIAAHIRRHEEAFSREVAEALLADPHIGLLESLATDEFWQPVFDTPLRWLRDLSVASLGDAASKLNTHLPGLESLALHGSNIVLDLRHDALRDLYATSASCSAIIDGTFALPALETLRWSLVENDPLVRTPTSILHVPPTTLTKLHVPDATSFVAGELAQCPIAERLTVLDLGDVRETAQLVELANHARVFPAVRELVLEGLPFEAARADREATLARLTDAFPHASVELDMDRWDEPRFRSRFAPATADD